MSSEDGASRSEQRSNCLMELSLGELNVVLCKGVVAEWNGKCRWRGTDRYREVQVHRVCTYGTALIQAG